jgi:hypothetical protein
MTKVNEQILNIFYRHMSMQSILDMKDNYNEVSLSKLLDMNKQATQSYSIKIDQRTMLIMFVFDADEVYNITIFTGSLFARNKDLCVEQIKDILSELKKEKEINSIVYKNARQIISMFYSVGFMPIKEKDKYIILEYIK